ncbi:hypothetical protein [Nonomuraea zeae]|uniref:Uncharacterized protein n=1 Tax=Nonomuraea zeae TaxID=1642303 RepID=A0A5S4F3H2_9ACTN|nr:hypothetical protein [Nonomuraea zeae]TMR10674.1 hypothetical protein ETD85_60200 [Nonomuraea zeae]
MSSRRDSDVYRFGPPRSEPLDEAVPLPVYSPAGPVPGVDLYEVAALSAQQDGTLGWSTIGWPASQSDAEFIAKAYVARVDRLYQAAQVWHRGTVVGDYRRDDRRGQT